MTASLPAGFTQTADARHPRHTVAVGVGGCKPAGAWIAATWGRIHPVLVAIPPILVAAIVLTTIYHVSLTAGRGG